jgi:hypothetical protein
LESKSILRIWPKKVLEPLPFVMLGIFWPDHGFWNLDTTWLFQLSVLESRIYNKSFWYKQPDNIKAIRFDIQTPKSDSAIIFQFIFIWLRKNDTQPLRFHAVEKISMAYNLKS